MVKGLVVSGEFGKILVREKSGAAFELGELLIADTPDSKFLLQVYDLAYGSQVSQSNRELVAGMHLEENSSFEFLDPALRNYNMALLKNLLTIGKNHVSISKTLPIFFSEVRELAAQDINFLTKPKNPLVIGKLRSGSKVLDVDVCLPADKVFAHHVLIAGTTGRGKSVLIKNILWSALLDTYCGILVLDPHDEYYGRNSIGLKDHPNSSRLIYYTPKNAPAGARTMRINLALLKPHHFAGVVYWSDPQEQMLTSFYRHYRDNWIESLLLDNKLPSVEFAEGTINVVKRRLMNLLGLRVVDGALICEGIFDKTSGLTTVDDICKDLEESKVVVLDSSSLAGDVEVLVGSLVASEVFHRYKEYRTKGQKDKPVISIVLEEAPRVLGKEVLEKGPNIFSSIAREGRKFGVGITAVTQLPSLIPREILANINTKIILGIEMKLERQAIIESASQDLSDDDRTIASLDTGEALVSSNFVKFATPIKIPFFEDLVKENLSSGHAAKKSFAGLKMSFQ
ncbi:MAG: ATP-binding protein [Candidatus Woesearchaeota archaeon]